MPTHPSIQEILQDMEDHARDELAFLLSTGAEHYATEDLHRLMGQLEIKLQLHRKLTKFSMYLAASAPVWLLGWLLFGLLGWKVPALGCLILFPLTLVLFFAGMLAIRSYFKGQGELLEIKILIRAELQQRRWGKNICN